MGLCNRRQMLQTMAAGVGACAIPTFGLASPPVKRPRVMGVDQFGSKWVVCWTDEAGDQNVTVMTTQCPVEHISQHIRIHQIERCVIDLNPDMQVVGKLAELHPTLVTSCRWTVQGFGPLQKFISISKPGAPLTAAPCPPYCAHVVARHHSWINPRHKPIVRHAVALEKIALTIVQA